MRCKYAAFLFVAAHCVAASFPDYPVKAATDYSSAVAKSGLTVAAIPMDDPQDQLKYFGMDMTSRGYIPVFVVLENQTSAESFLLSKEAMMFGPAAGPGAVMVNPAVRSKADKALAASAYVPYYGLLATIMDSKFSKLRQHILGVELQSTTLSPGSSAHGFVFIPARWKRSIRDKIQLTLPVARSGGGESVTIGLTI